MDNPNLQFAIVTANKPGLFETNLNRHGARAAALREVSAEHLKPFGIRREQLFLPGVPQVINFVMAPAARVEGRLLGTGAFSRLAISNLTREERKKAQDSGLPAGYVQHHQSPLRYWRVWLVGKELPPASSVLASADTDAEGNFVFENVPVGFEWQFQIERSTQGPEPASPPFKLQNADDPHFELEFLEQQNELHMIQDQRRSASEFHGRFTADKIDLEIKPRNEELAGSSHQQTSVIQLLDQEIQLTEQELALAHQNYRSGRASLAGVIALQRELFGLKRNKAAHERKHSEAGQLIEEEIQLLKQMENNAQRGLEAGVGAQSDILTIQRAILTLERQKEELVKARPDERAFAEVIRLLEDEIKLVEEKLTRIEELHAKQLVSDEEIIRTQAELLVLRRSKALKEGKSSEVERLFDEEINLLEQLEGLLRGHHAKALVSHGEIIKIQREILVLKRQKEELVKARPDQAAGLPVQKGSSGLVGELRDVASFKDNISTQHPIRIQTARAEILIRPGQTKLIALGRAVNEFWFGWGDVREKLLGESDNLPPITHVKCAWAEDGNIEWTLYAPVKAGERSSINGAGRTGTPAEVIREGESLSRSAPASGDKSVVSLFEREIELAQQELALAREGYERALVSPVEVLNGERELLRLKRKKAAHERKYSEVVELFTKEFEVLEQMERIAKRNLEIAVGTQKEVLNIQRERLALERQRLEYLQGHTAPVLKTPSQPRESPPPPQQGAKGADQKPADWVQLQGVWSIVSSERKGVRRTTAETGMREYMWTFAGDQVKTQWTASESRSGGGENAFTLDPTANPGELTIHTPVPIRALYTFEDQDTLKLCLFAQSEMGRPKEFSSHDGISGNPLIWTLKRQ